MEESELTFKELSRWALEARTATQIRNEIIRELRTDGHTLQSIADAAGMSKGGIALICKGANNE